MARAPSPAREARALPRKRPLSLVSTAARALALLTVSGSLPAEKQLQKAFQLAQSLLK